MSRHATTPTRLAQRAQMDVDDVLITLWDEGLDYLRGPDSSIKTHDVARAERACGLSSAGERILVKYWEDRLGLSPEQLRTLAQTLKVQIGPNARKLPKGALAKLDHFLKSNPVQSGPTSAISNKPPVKPSPPFEWGVVGKPRESLQVLSVDDVERIHWAIADDFADTADPIAPAGVRFPDLLGSAIGRATTGIGHDRKYPSVEMASAALMHSLVHNHPFYNGNKRTAVVAMLSQLDQNGLMLVSTQSELFNWTLRVAKHSLGQLDPNADRADQEVLLMSRWISNNSRPVDRGERIVTWATLRPRLSSLGCTVQLSGNRGGRYIVERDVEFVQRQLIGTRRVTERKRYSIPYGGDGRQVGRGHIKKLRTELHLAEDDGIDSNAFYGSDDRPVDDFIAEYRKLLRRLART